MAAAAAFYIANNIEWRRQTTVGKKITKKHRWHHIIILLACFAFSGSVIQFFAHLILSSVIFRHVTTNTYFKSSKKHRWPHSIFLPMLFSHFLSVSSTKHRCFILYYPGSKKHRWRHSTIDALKSRLFTLAPLAFFYKQTFRYICHCPFSFFERVCLYMPCE